MGAKNTKFEGSYLPDTPTLNKLRIASGDQQENANEMEPKDPRSPSGCRTPLPLNFLAPQMQLPAANAARNDNAFSQLRKRLLKGFALNDPRSPQLNRTPLMLDEVIDRTLNMDDTFADLFVDTRAPGPELEMHELSNTESSVQMTSFNYEEEQTMPSEVKLQQTPPAPQQTCDPRSPSIGVDRTPIIFCDDAEDEAREAKMLEDILETLTLNLSNESSLASFASAAAELQDDEPQPQPRPANKHLERVRLGNKQRVPPRKPARATKSQTPQRIYVDVEQSATSTPKALKPNGGAKRTPLSCVKNRTHLRSRSVEKDARKTRLPLQSFDDQLNPTECLNVPSLHILMASGEDSLDGSIY